MQALKVVLFVLICLGGTALGAMQCFAPAKLRDLQKRYWDRGAWPDGTGGKVLDNYLDRQARNPTVLYKLSGLGLMAFFLFGLANIGRLLR